MKLRRVLLACAAWFAVDPIAAAWQTSTVLVSVDSAGAPGNADSGLIAPGSLSADGRFVSFYSAASNLVAGDTNGVADAFVRDQLSGATERVSLTNLGAQANGASYQTSMSADGRFVAFESQASNLVAGDANAKTDVFVRDRTSGTTECVSVAPGSAPGNRQSWRPSISADGRFVAFESYAFNLVAGDTNRVPDVFVRDRLSGTTERVSVASGGAQGNDGSTLASISADGRFVAFTSAARNLVAADSNQATDIFVRDRIGGTTERVNVDSSGVQANDFSAFPAISGDGRFVAFCSLASNLVTFDASWGYDIFVRDRTNGTTELVSVDSTQTQSNGSSFYPSISADGRFVAFECSATNFNPNYTMGARHVFVRDRVHALTEIASTTTDGYWGNGDCFYAAISADGSRATFTTRVPFVLGDSNGVFDVYLRDRRSVGPTPYCTAGTTSNGCTASIVATANPSVSLPNSCHVTVTSVEGQEPGLLFYGHGNYGFTPLPWAPTSASFLCVQFPTQRTPLQNSGGTLNACDGSFVLDWSAYQSANPFALGNPWSVGENVYLQAWFRDPPAARSTNLSNAIEMTYVP